MAQAQQSNEVFLNYDDLNTLEEPLSFPAGPTTVTVSGMVDVPVKLNIDNDALVGNDVDVDFGITGQLNVNMEAELANRWIVGVNYFAQYDEFGRFRPRQSFGEGGQGFTDNVYAYIATSWGTFGGGNVAGVVRESTRHRRGVGNSFLSLDNTYGQLSNWGGYYQLRTGPFTTTITVDDDGRGEIGTNYQRPMGTHDIRMSARARYSKYETADELATLDSYGGVVLGELTYGASIFDIEAGYERLEGAGLGLDRWFVTGGAQTKMGTWSLSAQGHYGEVDGTAESSAALGLAYDIARGLSTNLGVNYRDAEIARNGITIIDQDETTATASMRYRF